MKVRKVVYLSKEDFEVFEQTKLVKTVGFSSAVAWIISEYVAEKNVESRREVDKQLLDLVYDNAYPKLED